MSLDVYLKMIAPIERPDSTGILVREDGQTKEVTWAEWNEKFPGREPVVAMHDGEDNTVFHANITHNLVRMAREAVLYDCVWRPDEHGLLRARHLIGAMRAGLKLLESEPERFKKLNPSNGWGRYSTLVTFVKEYLAACKLYPSASVRVSR